MVAWINRPNISRWIRRLSHAAALFPLAILILDYFSSRLTFNPIQAATQRTGDVSIALLTIMLLCTPVYTLTGIHVLSSLRKPLGLYSFLYASLHVLIYIVADYNLVWSEIFREIIQKPYLWLGLIAFIILLALSITSFNSIIAIMGRYWKPLQRLVYPAAVIIVIHYFMSLKGNILLGRGNILEPALFAIVILISFMIRIPMIRNQIRILRKKVNEISFRREKNLTTGRISSRETSGVSREMPIKLHKD